MDDADQNEDQQPLVHLALEYADGYLNFYIKFFSNYAPLPSCGRRRCRAVVYVAVGLNRTTWMGRPRAPTVQELSTATKFKTLTVEREDITVFNEFFSCPVRQDLFDKTMMRVQLCDVDRRDNDVMIGECDLWPSQYATNVFREMQIPHLLCRPDLGELELTVVYLPTAQRFCIDRVKGTNLKLDSHATELYTRFWLFSHGAFDEIHKTEHRDHRQKDDNVPYVWTKRIIFDLLRRDVLAAIVVVQAVEVVKGEKKVIGQFGLSASSPLCEQGLFRTAMKNPRKPATAIMRLSPGC